MEETAWRTNEGYLVASVWTLVRSLFISRLDEAEDVLEGGKAYAKKKQQ